MYTPSARSAVFSSAAPSTARRSTRNRTCSSIEPLLILLSPKRRTPGREAKSHVAVTLTSALEQSTTTPLLTVGEAPALASWIRPIFLFASAVILLVVALQAGTAYNSRTSPASVPVMIQPSQSFLVEPQGLAEIAAEVPLLANMSIDAAPAPAPALEVVQAPVVAEADSDAVPTASKSQESAPIASSMASLSSSFATSAVSAAGMAVSMVDERVSSRGSSPHLQRALQQQRKGSQPTKPFSKSKGPHVPAAVALDVAVAPPPVKANGERLVFVSLLSVKLHATHARLCATVAQAQTGPANLGEITSASRCLSVDATARLAASQLAHAADGNIQPSAAFALFNAPAGILNVTATVLAHDGRLIKAVTTLPEGDAVAGSKRRTAPSLQALWN